MAKLQDMLAVTAQDLREVCGIQPDMDLLDSVTQALGPAALNPNTAQIAAPALHKIVATVMASYDLPPSLVADMVAAVIDIYPRPLRYRACVAYLIAQNFDLRAGLLRRQSFNL